MLGQVHDAGYEPEISGDGEQSSGMYARAFNGITRTGNDSDRVLGSAGLNVVFGVPSEMASGKKVFLSRYRVYQLNGGSSANTRAPRSWSLYGSNDKATWSLVDQQTDVKWYYDEVLGTDKAIGADAAVPDDVDNGQTFEIAAGTDTDFRYFKFVPEKSLVTGANCYVFQELEYYGCVYAESDGWLEVVTPAVPAGEVSPVYGSYVTSETELSVDSDDVRYGDDRYRLKGWSLYTATANGTWECVNSGTGTTYTYQPDGGRHRLVWEWEKSDWTWTFVSDGTSTSAGTLKNGNWEFTVAETTVDGETGAELSVYSAGAGLLDLRQVESDCGVKIVAIANNLMQDNADITGIVMNDGLRRTGSYSFAGAKSLKSVVFGVGLTTLSDRTFKESGLSDTVDMSVCTGLTHVGSEAFYGCSAVETVVLPPRYKSADWRAFTQMSSLVSIVCTDPGESAREMSVCDGSFGSDVIASCPKLESIEVPWGGTVSFAGQLRGLTSLKTLKVNGKAPAPGTANADFFAAFGSVAAQPAYQLKIVVSSMMDEAGWRAFATREPTAEERARDDWPGSKTFGIVDLPESSRAWLVWGKSPFAKSGSMVIIR